MAAELTLSSPVDTLALSTRALNSLYRGEIYTIRDLLKASVADLRDIKDCGRGTINETRGALANVGILWPVNP